MNDIEYVIIDELYFVTSFADLQRMTGLKEDSLRNHLQNLLSKGWIKCLHNPEDEVLEKEMDFEGSYKTYHYLASKAGLMAHNSL